MRDYLSSVITLRATPLPQELSWLAAHQDYSSEPVCDYISDSTEEEFGERIIRNLFANKRGHFGVVEHAHITVNCIYQPHDVVAQVTRHRHATFDVQSFRYTSDSIMAVKNITDVEKAVYVRPVGTYTSRQGAKYEWTQEQREEKLRHALQACRMYTQDIYDGVSEEHARQSLPYSLRQHFVMTVNIRTLMHMLLLRAKKDAQVETQWFADDLFLCFKDWCPEFAKWTEVNIINKGVISP